MVRAFSKEKREGKLIDNRELGDMPGVTVSYSNEAPEHNYKVGFPLGFKKVKKSRTPK